MGRSRYWSGTLVTGGEATDNHSARPRDEDRFRWSPERLRDRDSFVSALRAIRARSGLGYQRFEIKGRLVVQSGAVSVRNRDVAMNPLPKTSLHRAIEGGVLGWFGAEPDRLAIFLRVAGCPEQQLDAWLRRLVELDTAAPSSSAPGPPAQPGPPVPLTQPSSSGSERLRRVRRPGRWVFLAAGLLAVGGVVFLLVAVSYAAFYGQLGLGLDTMPVGAGHLLLSTVYAMLILGAVAVVYGGSFTAGAALAPWQVKTRAAVPASALSVVLAGGAYLVAAVAVPSEYGGGVLAIAALFVGCGFQTRLIVTQRPRHQIAGLAIGLLVVLANWELAQSVGRWSGSTTWFVVALVVPFLAAWPPLRWWTTSALRRDGHDQAGPTSPAVLLRQLRSDIAPSIRATVRETTSTRDARRLTVGLPVGAMVMLVVVAWFVWSMVEPAGNAGRAVREYGFAPPGAEPMLIWPPAVTPAVVTLRRPGVDPVGICGESSSWAASVLRRDLDRSWVLLRPTGPGDAAPEVVRLDHADYAVRLVLDPAAQADEPWTRPVCQP